MQNIYYICNAIFYKMQERFKQLLEEKNLTATRFAAMIKVNASAMSHILNGRSKPGFDVLDKIAQAFPDVNLNWLISGKGSLYNNRISTPAKEVEKIPVQKNLFEEEDKSRRDFTTGRFRRFDTYSQRKEGQTDYLIF